MDSQPSASRQRSVVENLKWFLQFLPPENKRDIDLTMITLRIARTPKQDNSYDCGCFLVLNALKVFEKPEVVLGKVYVRIILISSNF